ncbi:MAG: fumarate hydratase, class [Frankiales bacterium]|jgi:fumarate hydratase class I|nr:fumarate hydratase, class [Frankiales bacterium]
MVLRGSDWSADAYNDPAYVYAPMLAYGGDVSEMVEVDAPLPRQVDVDGLPLLRVPGLTLSRLADVAIGDISHFLRTSHLEQLRRILDDPEASRNDRYVAEDLLRNAAVSAGGVLPMCQDTGTAIIFGRRGRFVLTDGRDSDHLSRGVFRAYQRLNLRYSQLSPLSMFEEHNTGSNLPAQIEITAEGDNSYEFLFMAKGGGSANKSFLYQETKALLNERRLTEFLTEEIASIGTSACPPYHLAVVIGGTSAEFALKTAKLATARYLDTMPTHGGPNGAGYRDTALEASIWDITRQLGIGAQFGGKYFCHDVRAIRLPRHNGSCPVAIAVSCSADRQAVARIDASGVFLEKLDRDPARFLPDVLEAGHAEEAVRIDLTAPMDEIRIELSKHPVGTRLSLNGDLVVARDLAHAEIAAQLDKGRPLPDYLKRLPVYYAGPAKTPAGRPSGSFGPTTAGRMDPYVERFQKAGGSLIMLAKGNRSRAVTRSCARYGGFYLGSIGGPAARLAQDCITNVEVIDYENLGMEAVWKITVTDFPAFVIIDDKGNDFYARPSSPLLQIAGPPGPRA